MNTLASIPVPSSNGHSPRISVRAKRSAKQKDPSSPKPRRASLALRQRLAIAVGSVGVAVLCLSQHAERLHALAALVGASIPCLVYVLARVAGHMWRD